MDDWIPFNALSPSYEFICMKIPFIVEGPGDTVTSAMCCFANKTHRLKISVLANTHVRPACVCQIFRTLEGYQLSLM